MYDILDRLRKEERERATAIRQWRQQACYGSIREDDDMHRLVRDAADEINRLRRLLEENGVQIPEVTS